MAITAADIRVKFSSDGADAVRKDITGVGGAVDGVQGKLSSWGQNLRTTGTWMTAGLTAPLVAFFTTAVNGASSLEQAQGKVDAVFKDSADVVHAWSETTSRAIGVSNTQALQWTGTIGNFFTSAGMAHDVSAQMSQDFVQLAADMGAFNDVSAARATDAIIGGMAGEYDALQRLGVNINAAKVEQEAFNIATADGRTEITDADMALARYNVIMRETSNQHGQFQRESKGFAGSMAILRARFSEVAAEIGRNLMPYALELVDTLSDLVEWFDDLSPSTQRWALMLAAAAAAAGPLLITIGLMASGLAVLLSPVGLIIAGIAALAAGLIYAYTHFETFRDIVDGSVGAIVTAIQSIIDVVSILRDAFAEGGWTGVWNVIAEGFQSIDWFGMALTAGLSILQGFQSVVTSVDRVIELAWTAITALNWSEFVPGLSWASYVAELLWDSYVGSLLWSLYVTSVVWADYIAELAWDLFVIGVGLAGYVTDLAWELFVTGVVLADYVASLFWSLYVTGVILSDYVDDVLWDLYITSVVLADKVVELSWDLFVSSVILADYVASLPWAVFVKGVDLATKVASLVWSLFVTAVDLTEKVVSLAWELFVDGVDLVDYVTSLAWSVFVKGVDFIGDAIVTALLWSSFISDISWSDFIPNLEWPSPGDILSAITGAIPGIGGGDDGQGSGAAGSTGDDGYNPNTSPRGGGAPAMFAGDWSQFPGMGGIGDISASLAATFAEIVATVEAGMESIRGTIESKSAEWGSALSAGTSNLTSIASAAFSGLQAVATPPMVATGAMVAAQTSLMMTSAATNWGAMAMSAMTQFPAMQVAGTTAAAAMNIGVTAAATAMNVGVTASVNAMRAASTAAATGMQVGVTASANTMRSTSTAAVAGMQAGIAASMLVMRSSAVSSANAMQSSVVAAMTNMALRSAAAVRSGMGQIPGIIASVGGAAAGVAFGVGAAIGNGVAAGMLSALGTIRAAANAMISEALRAAQARAIIASPSRLFKREVGEFISAGVAEGISGASHLVDRAVSNLIDPSMLHAPAFAFGSAGAGFGDRSRAVHIDARTTFQPGSIVQRPGEDAEALARRIADMRKRDLESVIGAIG